MSLKVPRAGGPQLFKEGYKQYSGIEDAVLRNIAAVAELCEIVRTSFGPNGRNKMVINHLERLFVTSDAATIVRELEVVHPAAKLLVMASQQQEAEMGDATNTVLILAGELLKKAEALVTLGLHPSEIIAGYEKARDAALSALEELSVAQLASPPTVESLTTAIQPVLASKQYGNETLLAPLVAQAISLVLPDGSSKTKPSLAGFNVDNVRVVKILGASLAQSQVLRGMVFGKTPEGSVRSLPQGGKVAIFTQGIDISQTETKGTVLLHNAKELQAFSAGEEAQLEKAIKEIADAGVNVVVSQSGVGELALHYLNRYKILCIKVLSKFEVARLARLVGATPLARLGAPLPEEAGWIDAVDVVEIGGDRVTVFRQDPEGLGGKAKPKMATIVLRGATTNVLDDVERAIDDGVNLVKSLTKDPRLVPGAGATEIQLAQVATKLGERTPGLAQHAIKRFGAALEVVPRTLSENAGLDPTEVIARLYAAHQEGQTAAGVDIDNNDDSGVVSATKAGVLDALAAKTWAIKYATGAAISVLNVDSIIMSKPAGIKAPKQNPNWDDD